MSERKTRVNGASDLLLYGFSGREGLSEPFVFEVSVLYETKQTPPTAAAMLGKAISIQLEPALSHGTSQPSKPLRYFHGHVVRMRYQGERGRYRLYVLELRPWLWLLEQSSDCRVFQNKTVPEIVGEVFARNGFSAFEKQLDEGRYPRRPYCVQYRETDLQFVSRLLEHEGIYYYFRHEQDRHVLVLADGSTPPIALADYATIEHVVDSSQHADTVGERIDVFHVEHQIRAGAYALKDYDFEKPALPLQAQLTQAQPWKQANRERFDYPGGYATLPVGERYTKVRLQAEQAEAELAQGVGNSHGLTPGYRFSLTKAPIADFNKAYVVVRAEYDFALDPYEATDALRGRPYTCRFAAIPADVTYRPPRRTPRPVIAGLQTAKVVGPAGEEIWTDRYGRIKVQFHWDREGKLDANSSCWVRVAQAWAGGAFGVQHIPRVGCEVVVGFLEGDPDNPVVVGAAHNGACSTPFALPQLAQVSGLKSDSTKGGGGSNELWFDDRKGAELVNLRAERDLTALIQRDRHTEVRGEDTLDVVKQCVIRAGKSSIRIAPDGISVEAPMLTLSVGPAAKITMLPTGIRILGKTDIPMLFAIPKPPIPVP